MDIHSTRGVTPANSLHAMHETERWRCSNCLKYYVEISARLPSNSLARINTLEYWNQIASGLQAASIRQHYSRLGNVQRCRYSSCHSTWTDMGQLSDQSHTSIPIVWKLYEITWQGSTHGWLQRRGGVSVLFPRPRSFQKLPQRELDEWEGDLSDDCRQIASVEARISLASQDRPDQVPARFVHSRLLSLFDHFDGDAQQAGHLESTN